MLGYVVFVATLLTTSFESLDATELDIYPYVLDAVRELKDRERAERLDEIPDFVQFASTSVCYDELGCFDTNETFRHLKQLPDTPENIATQFLLYTPSNKDDDDAQLLDYSKPKSVKNSNINGKKPLKVITHGFGGRFHADWMWKLKDAFIETDEANVIIVDWSNGAATPHYINSVVNAELVGAQIAALYYVIKDNFGIKEKNFHIMGFSLGAQVMGFVGKRMRKTRGTKPGRITGLDPAGPLYEDYGTNVHLYSDDADLVDVIHTNADLLIYGGLGIRRAIGHVDYYPNGGVRQPGCNSTIKGAITDLWNKGERQKICNHERAVQLYLDSIRPRSSSCQFFSYQCEDFNHFQEGKCFECVGKQCGVMGYKNSGSGVHYLLTHDKAPFCAEALLFSGVFSESTKKSYGAIFVTLIGSNGKEQNVSITKEKDERLLPGDSRVFTAVLSPEIKTIKKVKLTYVRYNGWFAKGTPTFTMGSLAIRSTTGKFLFSHCRDLVLSDDESVVLESAGEDC